MKEKGVRVHFIAKLLQAQHGVAISTTYYHLSDNRQAYDNEAKKIRKFQKERIQEKIHTLIESGYNTGEIARDWNIPLAIVNKIYTS